MAPSSPRTRRSIAATLVLLAGIAACSGRSATVESEAPVVALPIEADFYGTYDIYFDNAPGQAADGGHEAALTATWSAEDFVVSQRGSQMIRTDIAIDPATPETGELRIWDEQSSDPLCAAEGLYDYTDDGRTITLTLQTDPCPNRSDSADGSRLVRRE